MQDNQSPKTDAEIRKEKIRAKYQSAIPDDIDIIPATPQENFFEDDNEKRVAFYVRVSTDDPRQTSSFELQKGHYTEMLNRHKSWRLADIYAEANSYLRTFFAVPAQSTKRPTNRQYMRIS